MSSGIDHQDTEYTETDDHSSQQCNSSQNKNEHHRYNDRHWGGHSKYASTKQTTSIQTSVTTSSIIEEISEEYLSTSLLPSHHTAQPCRKLLVLDLNGTLVYRLPPPPRSRFRSRFHVYSHTSPAPTRVAHPRPYLPSFRRYLFHPATRVWLDVMVWSSAQPHSVKDMLRFCFPKDEQQLTEDDETEIESAEAADDRFFAVWARDTLGLSRADYCEPFPPYYHNETILILSLHSFLSARKVQTTKNLEKIWDETAITPPSSGSFGGGVISESKKLYPKFIHSHSSASTLLLDDSPLKARLQPWNHLCIREYDGAVWKKNTQIIQSRKTSISVVRSDHGDTDVTRTELQETRVSKQIGSLQGGSSPQNISYKSRRSLSSIETSSVSEPGNASVLSTTDSETVSSTRPYTYSRDSDSDSEPDLHLDETLLATIGVLEELKHQSNVCGWLRNRGLWIKEGGLADTATDAESATSKSDSLTDERTPIHSMPETVFGPAQSSSIYANVKPLSLNSEEAQNIPGLSSLTDPASGVVSDTTLKRKYQDLSDTEFDKNESKRFKSSQGAIPVTPPPSLPSATQQEKHTFPCTSTDTPMNFNLLATASSHGESSSTTPTLWFEDDDVFAYWVKQGRRVLQRLGIAESHGLEVSDNTQ